MSPVMIKLSHISKRYFIHSTKPTLIENLNPFKPPQEFWALQDVSLSIKTGDRIGIVGPNGSGKTTLLKIIAGITTPTLGKVTTYGKVVSIIDLTSGFQPDLTGKDNIYLQGLIMGMTKAEIDAKLSSIIAFSGLQNFINIPTYTYSTGMNLRLAFSVAVHIHHQILLLDEYLSSGDKDFQIQAKHKIAELSAKGVTILLCNHNLSLIAKFTRYSYVLINNHIYTQDLSPKAINVYNQYHSTHNLSL
jgi:ABC-type polysaccharide/polyol phosphate transport system ATPase subunit